VLATAGIEKAYRRGLWPLARGREVLRGAELTLYPAEVDFTNFRRDERDGRVGPAPHREEA
jgi:hypothetical protein